MPAHTTRHKTSSSSDRDRQKKTYERPVIIPLGELVKGSGNCSNGSNPTGQGGGNCKSGSNAGINNCINGGNPNLNCNQGGNKGGINLYNPTM